MGHKESPGAVREGGHTKVQLSGNTEDPLGGWLPQSTFFFFWCVQLWELVKQSNKLAVFTCDANVWNFWAISLEENAAIKRERSRTGWNPQAHTETHVEGLKLICFSASDIGGGVTSAAQAFHHRAKHTLGPKTQWWKRFSGKVELLQT